MSNSTETDIRVVSQHVVSLYDFGASKERIAELMRISLRDVDNILNRYRGVDR